ncbi:RuvC-like resolvase [Microbacterium phage Big4]|nr:RuvC-like resolvase [Microbacterium phage Big4]
MTARRIYAIDPGKATGLSVFSLEKGKEPVLEWSAEVDEDTFAIPLRVEFAQYPHLEVVCERFVITVQTAKNTQAPYSLELIGVMKQIVRDHNRSTDSIHFQSPSDVMKLFPNPALKKLGYWHKGGAGHANDSIRHGLAYMAGNGWMPTRLLD